ncbi:MAG: energy transducer TonB [Candidatus Binataceae bacterium]
MAHESNRSTDNRGDNLYRDARGYALPPRHLAAIAGSVAAHALILCAIVFLAARGVPQGHQWVLAYVIDLGTAHGIGGDIGGSMPARLDPGPASPPEEATPIDAVPAARPKHHARRRDSVLASLLPPERPIEADSIDRADDETMHRDSSTAAAPPSGANHSETAAIDPNHSASEGGSGGQGGAPGAGVGSAAGDGTGGTTIARADYDSDPAPFYPSRSRRRGEQGIVTLHVLIAANGAVERVELIASSGFRDLDDAALETVRSRWRFVPARRDGIAFESWVVVPIRFALTEASN